MKKNLLSLFVALSAIPVWNSAMAQNNKIDPTGSVGIGTTVPFKTLDVRTPANDYMSVGYQLNLGQFSGIHFGYLENNNLYRKSALVFERLDNSARGKIHLLNNGGVNEKSASLADARLTIDYDGNVGIGTVNPTEKLSVKGIVRAQEIKVEGGIWPDYVFAKSYKLPGLQDTEQFIQKNGHLPGIPSASEVKKNGVELGSLNAKLLEKIEELTLYMIEMRKDNEQLKKRVVELESKNNK